MTRGKLSSRIGYQDGCVAENNVIAFLERRASSEPGLSALMWVTSVSVSRWREDRHTPLEHAGMTYGELTAAVRNTAGGLRELGVRKGDRVFLFVPMSAPLYIAMFAIQRLGAIAVFLDSWARASQLAMCARLVQAKAMIAPPAAYAYAGTVPGMELPPVCIAIGDGPSAGGRATLGELAASGIPCGIEPVEREHTALITFTTGSSGIPKGADRSHRFLAAQHDAISRELTYGAGDVDLVAFPIFSLNNLAGGVRTVIPAVDLARPSPADGDLLAAQILDAGVTCCTLSPSLLRALSAQPRPLPILRRVATGGAPISSDDVAAFHRVAPEAQLLILYGSTEVEPIAHLDAANMPPEHGEEGVCVGTICSGLDARLIRVHRGPLELGPGGWAEWEAVPGDVGELSLSGEHVCPGYYHNDDAFRATKIVEANGTLWHRSGDLCRLDSQQRLWIVGRVHNAIQRDGKLLFPVRPEVIMKRLPFVERAAYVGLPDPDLGERAVAVFTVAPGCTFPCPEDAVRAALEADGMVVDEVRCVVDIPLDPRHNSKVEYTRLRAQLQQDEP